MDFTRLADDYLAAWNDTDPSTRRARVDALWAPDGRYIDPMAVASGRAEIDATIGAVQEQFAGLRFARLGDVDAHHDQARFGWSLGPDGTEPLVVGFDVAVRDADGRLSLVLGFLDRVPA